jgi:cobyrinic acid a,c-diamide synthase
MTVAEIRSAFAQHAAGADVAIVEGNKGLYDGLDLEGSNSNAALAALLGAPVVLVIDTRGMTQGIAPLLHGYLSFDPSVRIAGVILNKTGGSRHEGKLRAAVERYTDLPVLGTVRRDPRLEIAERHLGLTPAGETSDAADKLDAFARAVAEAVDLDRLLELAAAAPVLAAPRAPRAACRPRDLRIGVARDRAFCFYYPDDLAALEAAGAELVPIDILNQGRLPPVDGLFIGGGFPETHLEALEANAGLRSEIRQAIEAGLPAYAECGGLMYLARSIAWRGATHRMAGVIPGDVVVHAAPQGRGYVRLRETGMSPWPAPPGAARDREIPAHEFHYSSLENLEGGPAFAYEVLRGHGVDGRHDGIVRGNLLASYAHLRDTAGNPWARRFVEFVRACKRADAPRWGRATGS